MMVVLPATVLRRASEAFLRTPGRSVSRFFGDDNFDGSHSEQDQYEVFVDAYDFFDDPIDSFSELRTLAPGIVHDFSFDDFD